MRSMQVINAICGVLPQKREHKNRNRFIFFQTTTVLEVVQDGLAQCEHGEKSK